MRRFAAVLVTCSAVVAAALLSPAAMKRLWLACGVAAAVALLMLAALSQDRGQSLQRHEASGPMQAVAGAREQGCHATALIAPNAFCSP